MDELTEKKIDCSQEINDNQLMTITIQDEFEDYYIPPLMFKIDLINKANILKKHKKEDNLLDFEEG